MIDLGDLGYKGCSEMGFVIRALECGVLFQRTLKAMTTMDGGNATRGRMPVLPMARYVLLKTKRHPCFYNPLKQNTTLQITLCHFLSWVGVVEQKQKKYINLLKIKWKIFRG
ncbi:MAG: hypothetical protein IME94_10115 [Proteobacteria bacterium]|nr:hypothetical protein [Pseudomonadota bacterium]